MVTKFFTWFDSNIFKMADKVKASPGYEKTAEAYNQLEDKEQDIARAIIAVLIVIIPLVILLFVFFSNSSLKSDLEFREKLLYTANEVKEKQKLISVESAKILSPSPISNQGQLSTKVIQIANSAGINSESIKISNFNSTPSKGKINISSADLKLSNFSNKDLFVFIMNLVSREKIKIENYTITRNDKTGFLESILSIVHYSRSIGE